MTDSVFAQPKTREDDPDQLKSLVFGPFHQVAQGLWNFKSADLPKSRVLGISKSPNLHPRIGSKEKLPKFPGILSVKQGFPADFRSSNTSPNPVGPISSWRQELIREISSFAHTGMSLEGGLMGLLLQAPENGASTVISCDIN